MRYIRDRKITLGISVVLLAILFLTAPQASLIKKNKKSGDFHPRMESSLWQLYQIYLASGKKAARTFARQQGLIFNNGQVQIVAETDPLPSVLDLKVSVELLGREIEALGGRVEASYRYLVQNSVPVESLRLLAEFPTTHYLRPPMRPIPLTVSEGVEKTGADSWQGLTAYRGNGQSAKVCILDVGFQGYAALLGTELPAATEVVSFRADEDIEANNPHGTACAEIVHDMAPNAQLVLVNFGTDVEQHNAVEWLVNSDVDIISYSSGWLSAGAGDGTGPICEDVNKAQKAGILWISAAGNSAESHWQEKFRDKNGNDWHDFNRSFKDEGEFFAFYVSKGEKFSIWLNWDDWGNWDGTDYSDSEGNDYDLYLYNAEFVEIARSTKKQKKGALPTERITLTPKSKGVRYIRIFKRSAPRDCRLELFFTGVDDLEFVDPYGSLNVPADSPYALAVGATNWADEKFHVYTSRGPTNDGRVKPDLVAPSGVSTVSYGKYGTYGTSASAAHVAGAIALMREKSPYSFEQILEILSSRALDLGPAGKDNLYGQGRLKLVK